MTVTQLRPVAPLRAELDAIVSAVDSAAAIPPQAVRYHDLPEALAIGSVLESRLTALKLELLAEADRRRLAEEEAATGTDAWAASLTGSTRAVMAGGLWLVERLRSRYHYTRDAFARGRIDIDQVRVIVRAGEKIPPEISDEDRATAEEGLVAKAVQGRPRPSKASTPSGCVITPDACWSGSTGSLPTPTRPSSSVTRRDAPRTRPGWFSATTPTAPSAVASSSPSCTATCCATTRRGCPPPARLGRNRTGDLVSDETVPGMGNHFSFTERMGLAFTEMLEHLPTEGFGTVGANLLVTVDLAAMPTGLGHARLDTGARISPDEARRLACNAGIVPVVLGSRSEPLDLGREARLHNTAQRRALALHHDACAAEGCERPFAWCDIHHREPWSQGGRTDLDNALPLCGHHHRRAHDERYRTTITGAGEMRFRLR